MEENIKNHSVSLVPVGLSSAEAAEQLKKFGPNEIISVKKLSGLLDFLSLFKNPLLLILLAAASISGFLGDVVSAGIIFFIVLASVILDYVNTYKSQKAAEELKKQVMITSTVVRDGQEKELPLSQIVPDDLLILEAGDIVPADAELVIGKDVFANESSLTGESYPAEKLPGAQLFMGSSIVTGEAKAIVRTTGRNTKFSHIAEALVGRDVPTEFDRGLSEFSFFVMKIIFIMVIFLFLINALFKGSIINSFLFAAAVAVGVTPELLPMIIAMNLSKGSLKMSKRGIIVKKLSAIQNFGNMDILCTDKTGTLTEDKITVVKYLDWQGEEAENVLLCAYLSSALTSSFRSPLDEALREFRHLDDSQYKKIDEIPFDFSRRRDSIVVEKEDKHILITKGAPEQILEVSSFIDSEGKISETHAKKALEVYEDLSRDGFRVLAVAQKIISSKKEIYTKEDEKDLSFLGFIAFLDPPKTTVINTLKMLEKYGIEIKILTGDNELVTKKIAGEIKLPVKGMLTGAELDLLSDAELHAKAENTTIFSRVAPNQKERIINILRASGHVVGYLGDGINDAPSLKAADVGISVSNAVDVAKDTADLILIKKSLKDLVEGVIEGRRIFANTMKYLMMNLSSNFGNMFSMAGASILLPFFPMTAPQILLNNLLYDSSQLAIPTDKVDEEYIRKPRQFKINFIKKFMFIFGPASSVFDFMTFFVLYFVFHLKGGSFQTGWFLESIATQTLVVYMIRTKKIPFIQSSPSGPLLFSTITAVCVAWLIPFLPIGKLFELGAIGVLPIITIILIVVGYLFMIEFLKRWFFRKMVSDE